MHGATVLTSEKSAQCKRLLDDAQCIPQAHAITPELFVSSADLTQADFRHPEIGNRLIYRLV